MEHVTSAPNKRTAPDPLDGLTESEWRTLAARLREARRHIGLLQDDVARVLNFSRSTVSAIERGERRVAPLELRRLARLYRRPVEWLLGEEAELSESLLRATEDLAARDKQQVLRSAEILAGAARS